jgi:midasin
VLEGLNACLDHRGTVFIPELNRSFEISQKRTRIFGCQNPPREGGDRKNLPKSFLNRFVKVYLSEFDPSDLALICCHQFPSLPEDVVARLVRFAVELHRQVPILCFQFRSNSFL